MDDYVDYLAEVVRLGNPSFEKYFLDNWNSCIDMWVAFKRDSSIHFGNTTNNRLECSHSKLKDLVGRTSSLSEMFEGVLTFIKFVNQESSHHAFVEQFMSVSTNHDHLPGMKHITAMCTEYASRLLLHQVEVAQKVDYEFSDSEGPVVTVKYKDHTHKVDIQSSICTCSFWSTMLLPCRHIISVRLYKGLSIVDHNTIHQRWLKSYQIDFVVDNSNPGNNGDISHHVECDILSEPPMQGTLSQSQKYKRMLSLCQRIAVQASMVGMPQFREMHGTIETLLHNWEAGMKCVVVSCNDECEEVISSEDLAVTEPAMLHEEDATQYEDVTEDNTQHEGVTEDTTWHEGNTWHEDATRREDATRHEDVTQHEDATRYEDSPQGKDEMTRKENQETDDNKTVSQSHQLKRLANITSITKNSIHLKPCVKVRGRPKYSSKFWPSKSKWKSDAGKENVQPSAQPEISKHLWLLSNK